MINHKGSTGQIKIDKGSTGQIEIDEEANIFFGQMLNIFDILTFKGETIAESK